MKNTLTFLFLLGQSISTVLAQPAGSQPLKLGDITVSGSLRTRVEAWDWFQGSANNDYTFPGSLARLSLSESSKVLDWQIEFAAPFLLGLPDDSIAPGAQGQLGFGARNLWKKMKKELSILGGNPQSREEIAHTNPEMFIMLIHRCGMVHVLSLIHI